MHVEATDTFIRLYKKYPPDLKSRIKRTIEFFKLHPSHPSLGHKKMVGYEDIYEIPAYRQAGAVTRNYRITYQRIGDTAYLRKIGTHDLLNNP